MDVKPRGRIAILSGERGSGKTSACLELIERSKAAGLDCAGLVSPERDDPNLPPGQDVMDVRTGERRRFSFELDEPAEGSRCRHRFDQRAAEWAAACLGSACPCDLLVIDEVGPLALEQGKGWPNAFEVLASCDFGLAVAVVRPSYVQTVVDRIVEGRKGAQPVVVTPDELRQMAARLESDTKASASLERYRQKRDFSVTGEPRGGSAEAPAPGHRFVVQRHRARRLHYDFRLEIDGVLASWAVPKGPTLDPSVRRLAVHVEDHPLEYFDFEGVIPKGEYGAGDVIVWDWGTFEQGRHGDPAEGLRKGEMAFELHGEKVRGEFALVRTTQSLGGSGDEPSWLLIKKRDEDAVAGWNAESFPRSVKSGRTNDEVKAGAHDTWSGRGPTG